MTPSLRKALSKQGYQVVGSHSGVKLCRWTKVISADLPHPAPAPPDPTL